MEKISSRIRLAFICIILMVPLMSATAQVSEGGMPTSFTIQGLTDRIDTREFPAPDMEQINAEDQLNAQSDYPGPERMGVSVMAGVNTHTAGTWEWLEDGSKLWRLKIVVRGALALGVYYDHFHLPEGSKLFLYNEEKTQVIGAFTSFNNPVSGLFATQFIQGETVTLEYSSPAGQDEEAVISISEVAYAYRHIYFTENGGPNRDPSWPCMINVACEEGDGWEDQSQGIARISIKIGFYYYWCSGSLINNTNNDRTPYFLTAEHCGNGASSSDLNQWIFYFNYQASTCSGTYGPQNNTVSGCTLKARDPLDDNYLGADFELVLLNATPPPSYNVFYNGWNRMNQPADSGVSLHHPAGDIKKVSTYEDMTSSTWWNGTPSHWRITWEETLNGLSIMQGGSSGSPVFDQDRLIMGDLSGGYESNSCQTPSPAWYGKIWYAWDLNGSVAANRLKDWLDPGNTGVYKLPGLSSQVLPPVVDFIADTTEILQYGSVQFTDLTTGNPATSWSWTFEGGNPGTSADQNPAITYNQAGTFDVSLTVVNPDGSGTETKTDYITVSEVLLPDADFVASQVEIIQGEMIGFTDLTTNNPTSWNWTFSGGEPASSIEQHPDSIVYNEPGSFDVVLTAENNAGSNTEYKENYITVNPGMAPVADFYADVTEILTGDSVNFFDLSANNPTQWIWTFYGGIPDGSSDQNPANIVYPAEGTYDVKLIARNAFGNNTLVKEGYITVGGVGVNEGRRQPEFAVYPNPSEGIARIRFAGSMMSDKRNATINVAVLNALGVRIMELEHDPADGELAVDLSTEPDGLYIIRVTGSGGASHKILSLSH